MKPLLGGLDELRVVSLYTGSVLRETDRIGGGWGGG